MLDFNVGDKVMVVLGKSHIWRDMLTDQYNLTAEVPAEVIAPTSDNTVAVRITDPSFISPAFADGGYIAIDDTEAEDGRFYGVVRLA